VKKVGGEADYVMSLCWGAFVLGEAGLLDGRAATTFPADYDTFAERFPGTEVKVNVSFVHDGKALTSQGGVRSFDVALYLADLLYGEDAARGIGGGLLIPWPPDLETGPDFAVVPAPGKAPKPAQPASP
jgi:transcriptional regulator GlxA family with amidase domain